MRPVSAIWKLRMEAQLSCLPVVRGGLFWPTFPEAFLGPSFMEGMSRHLPFPIATDPCAYRPRACWPVIIPSLLWPPVTGTVTKPVLQEWGRQRE